MDNALDNAMNVNLKAQFGILSNSKVKPNAQVTFSTTGDVFLDPGFEVEEMGSFEIDGAGCPD